MNDVRTLSLSNSTSIYNYILFLTFSHWPKITLIFRNNKRVDAADKQQVVEIGMIEKTTCVDLFAK